MQIGRKAPPSLFYFLVRYSARVMWCDITLPNHISCITEHLIRDRQKSPPPPPVTKDGKHSETGSVHFIQFPATLVQLAEKKPPPSAAKEGKDSETGSIHFMQFPATLVQLAEKPPPTPPPFCLFMRDPAHVAHVKYPWSPYYKSTLRFLLSKYLLYVTNFVNFSKYSYIQKFKTQDHGAAGRPIGNLTTIHTNIPAITVTVLAMALWSIIRILYLYASMSFNWVTKLFFIHLEESWSP